MGHVVPHVAVFLGSCRRLLLLDTVFAALHRHLRYCLRRRSRFDHGDLRLLRLCEREAVHLRLRHAAGRLRGPRRLHAVGAKPLRDPVGAHRARVQRRRAVRQRCPELRGDAALLGRSQVQVGGRRLCHGFRQRARPRAGVRGEDPVVLEPPADQHSIAECQSIDKGGPEHAGVHAGGGQHIAMGGLPRNRAEIGDPASAV
mmetsp:Transcript_16017/g.55675  ORF Transcript_16017/g.55675 Transcript_16017/m.55675 type:complete len:201 (-) Transcript_16017:468-1070(-)